MSTVCGRCLCCARARLPTLPPMVLRMKDREFMRLRRARGLAIEVLDGRVWITEDGRHADSFLAPGERYRVAGDGLVLIGAETGTEVRVFR